MPRKDGYTTFAMSLTKRDQEELDSNIKFLRKHFAKKILRSRCKVNQPFEEHASNKDIILYCVQETMLNESRAKAQADEISDYWRNHYEKLDKHSKEKRARYDSTINLG